MDVTRAKSVAFLGVMTALLFVVFALETVIGSVFITPPAFLSLSVVFLICFSKGWKTGLYSGVIFGVSSLLIAWIIGNPLFILPWISILPRLFVGISAYAVFVLAKNCLKNTKSKFVRESLPYSIGAGFGIILNTFLVLVCLTLFAPAEYGNTFIGWIQLIITLNFPIEFAVSVILVPIFSNVYNKIYKE